MRTILQLGNDPTLLTTRASVLRLTGASVIAVSAKEAVDMLCARHIDLIVFCHTVSPSERETISLEAYKLNVTVRILKVLRFTSIASAPDEMVADPEPLLAKVMDTLHNAGRTQQSSK